MKGHVRKHGRGWQWIINRDGHQTSKAGFPTRTAAQDALNRELVRVSDGVNVDRSTMTVRSYLVDLWLPAVKGSLARTTYANYKTHVDQHLVDQLGDVPLQKLSEAHLLKSWATLRESGRRRGKNPKDKGLSPATVRHIHRMLHKALEDAVEWRYLSRNVAASRQAKPPTAKGEAQELKAWSAGELKRFLASISEDRLVPMWRFMAMTGCRRGEALGLRWDDVNLKTGSVRIMRSRTGYGISTPKTKTSTRGVDLDPGTTALKAWRRAQRLERVKAGPGWEDSNLVFTREDGLGYHPDAVTAMFGRKVGRLKVNPITLHGLRHTHATLLLAAGENPRVVSERLGHSSVGLYPPGLCARPTRPPACDGGTLRRSDRGLGSAH